MDVMNTIYDVDSVATICSFIKGLFSPFEDLIKNTPYGMAKVRMRAKGIFIILKSREKLAKKMTVIIIDGTTTNMPKPNKKSFAPNMQSWDNRKKVERKSFNCQCRPEVPHYDLNITKKAIFMENRDNNIFCPL